MLVFCENFNDDFLDNYLFKIELKMMILYYIRWNDNKW